MKVLILSLAIVVFCGVSCSAGFIDYQEAIGSDGGTVTAEHGCENVPNRMTAQSIVDNSGCFILYSERDCRGNTDRLVPDDKRQVGVGSYSITHVKSVDRC